MNPIDEKLLHHIRERSTEDKVSGCWIWNLSNNSAHYANVIRFAGHFYGGDGVNQNAHRLAYRAMFGEIPNGLQIDHLCGRKDCVNPHHLQAVSASVNRSRSRISEPHPLSTYWFAIDDLPLVIPRVSDTGCVDGTSLTREDNGHHRPRPPDRPDAAPRRDWPPCHPPQCARDEVL